MTKSTFMDGEASTAVARSIVALEARQKHDGHWLFDLEADATIPAEYVLLEHFMDRITPERQRKIGVYLRRIQTADGGWPLFKGGAIDLSATVKAYYALKLIGDEPELPHMSRARTAILALGGAERANVFTRIQLALFEAVPWRAVPIMPVEIMHLPRNILFSIWSVSYWSRTCIVPLLVIQTIRPRARNPRAVRVDELFCTPPHKIVDWLGRSSRSGWDRFFVTTDKLLRRLVPFGSKRAQAAAIAKAVAFVDERMNGEDGLGAIYPAMGYSLMMYDALGHSSSDPSITTVWRALDRLVVENEDEAFCQPCVSPIWDTALAGHALLAAAEHGLAASRPAVDAACRWLSKRQISAVYGDWAKSRPNLEPGGWAFQYNNDHYPDVDDTAVVGMLLHRADAAAHRSAIERARHWICGMQGRDGGWGAFDADNNRDVLNHIPFADHGALLDPSTADVTARCISFLAQLGHGEDRPVIDRGLRFLFDGQSPDGSWFGRWGCNHIYGTWSVLQALEAAGCADQDCVRKAARWLTSVQHDDGGWGEDERSYDVGRHVSSATAQPSQTAWALLALIAAGQVNSAAAAAGRAWLERHQNADGTWTDDRNAVGFPRVFYLRYHGYPVYFPLLALSQFEARQQELVCGRPEAVRTATLELLS